MSDSAGRPDGALSSDSSAAPDGSAAPGSAVPRHGARRSSDGALADDGAHGPDATAALERGLGESQRRGFLGPGEVMFHVEHARGFLTAMEGVTSDRFLDLGSGGGVPGLVLALLLPEREAVLLDAMARRCQFLEWAVATLGLEERVTVECGRAEELARRADLRGAFPVVVTRSFGPPAVTAECAAGFLRSPGGQLLVSEPPELDRRRWPAEGLARLGLTAGERMQDGTTTIQTLHSTEALAERYPRRTGVPDKRPLF